jgi:tRNA dimethylallyltransferase
MAHDPAPARRVVAIFGPTAAGKTSLALRLAERAGGEIVSCDSMQLYRGLPVLTAQPTAADEARAPHHLVGVWPIGHDGSVGEYAELAHAAIDAIREQGRLAIVAGGTGLYLRGALVDLRLPPAVPDELRRRFEGLYDEQGADAAHAVLAERDARAAEAVHPNDRRRVVRALELQAVGASLRPDEDALWGEAMRVPTHVFTVEWERDALLERIDRRTDAMLAGGALDEVRALLASGAQPSTTASQILGLRELREHLLGHVTLGEARERMLVRTRQYARRQSIWLRKIPRRIPLSGADGDDRNADLILDRIA